MPATSAGMTSQTLRRLVLFATITTIAFDDGSLQWFETCPLGGADMSDSSSDAPSVRIIPPLVYLAGLVIGFLANIWMPIKVVPSSVAWTSGGILIFCGAVLAGSAIFKFKDVGTTVRPDRAASTLVIVGPYKITRNPM